MGMVRTYTSEAGNQHHTPGTEVESTRKKKKGTASEQLEARFGGRYGGGGCQLARTDKDRTKPGTMESCCQWPMLHNGVDRPKNKKKTTLENR